MSRYRFVTAAEDYSDFASGAVLHSAPGRPAFPVRLASELFLRAYAIWQAQGGATTSDAGCTLFDPCCGAGYLLAVLKLLHGEKIGHIIGSDIDAQALDIAGRNLHLLTPAGMAARRDALIALAEQHGKDSHRQHAAAAQRLYAQVRAQTQTNTDFYHLFQADALDAESLAASFGEKAAAALPIDIVLTDVPYGEVTQWLSPHATTPAQTTSALLAAMRGLLQPGAIMVVAGLRAQMAVDAPAGYARAQRVRIGHREARIWKAV